MAVPKYIKIKENLIEKIELLDANTPVSSERELAKELDVSRMTARKAIDALVDEGYLYRDANRGTFVADESLRKKNTSIYEPSEEVNITYKTIYFDVKASASSEVQEILNLDVDDGIVRVVRVTYKDDIPQAVEEIYVKRLDLSDQELASVQKWKDFSKYIDEGSLTQRFLPTLVPMQYAHLLNMKINDPIILIENFINTKSGRIMFYIKLYNNPSENVIEITS